MTIHGKDPGDPPPWVIERERVADQPPPRPAQGDLWAAVIADMQDRRRLGIARYGTPLQPWNGRDALVDAYQEALDQTVYLRQRIAEADTVALLVELSKVAAYNPEGRLGWSVGRSESIEDALKPFWAEVNGDIGYQLYHRGATLNEALESLLKALKPLDTAGEGR